MNSVVPKIFLTGMPGCGKTTAVVSIIGNLKGIRLAGFYTEEIRRNDTRAGFRWKRLDGPEGILAHIDIKGELRVGRYGVDTVGFEQSVVPVIDPGRGDVDVFVVDEIGKMECLSKIFVESVRRLLNSDKIVLATVSQKGGGLINDVKSRPGIILKILTENKRDGIIKEVTEIISSFCSAAEI